MVHKEQYQMLADAAARNLGGFASHIGKIGEETFIYSVMPASSSEYNPSHPTLIVVHGDDVNVATDEAAALLLAQTSLRDFDTGRAIFKKYQVLLKNRSAMIGDNPAYSETIVEAAASKAIKKSLLYQYLEIAEHYHRRLQIDGSTLSLT